MKGLKVKGIADPIQDRDAVNLQYLKKYVKDELTAASKTADEIQQAIDTVTIDTTNKNKAQADKTNAYNTYQAKLKAYNDGVTAHRNSAYTYSWTTHDSCDKQQRQCSTQYHWVSYSGSWQRSQPSSSSYRYDTKSVYTDHDVYGMEQSSGTTHTNTYQTTYWRNYLEFLSGNQWEMVSGSDGDPADWSVQQTQNVYNQFYSNGKRPSKWADPLYQMVHALQYNTHWTSSSHTGTTMAKTYTTGGGMHQVVTGTKRVFDHHEYKITEKRESYQHCDTVTVRGTCPHSHSETRYHVSSPSSATKDNAYNTYQAKVRAYNTAVTNLNTAQNHLSQLLAQHPQEAIVIYKKQLDAKFKEVETEVVNALKGHIYPYGVSTTRTRSVLANNQEINALRFLTTAQKDWWYSAYKKTGDYRTIFLDTFYWLQGRTGWADANSMTSPNANLMKVLTAPLPTASQVTDRDALKELYEKTIPDLYKANTVLNLEAVTNYIIAHPLPNQPASLTNKIAEYKVIQKKIADTQAKIPSPEPPTNDDPFDDGYLRVVSSDRQLKTNIQVASDTGIIPAICTFKYIQSGRNSIGVIAQDLLKDEEYKGFVFKFKGDEYYKVNYIELHTKMINELVKELDTLKSTSVSYIQLVVGMLITAGISVLLVILVLLLLAH